ncbi:hypothetical protein CGX12_09705 [Zobellella denitrificans]|jgi:hypothetical protein|uniref:Uncharacterized protein n=1 Tax=Zobellella denitrificans TaxID=347534 RepID=A0A231MYL5_9GAMM|nr:hypothetical protein [Zobellella denitrificans]ATG74851.1 hypothetical protein AN401_14120 [Zobellella denitrificans]OXS15312.1 hypothetical protein CGX12_09705 [Zobellella denitrificans]
MDSRLVLIFLLLPLQTQAQELRFSIDPQQLISDTPKRYGLDLELRENEDGNARLAAYPRLQLTPESSVSLSIKDYRPNLNLEGDGYKTSLRLRGDGVKLSIRPRDPRNRLEVDLKITDDESSLDLRYKF